MNKYLQLLIALGMTSAAIMDASSKKPTPQEIATRKTQKIAAHKTKMAARKEKKDCLQLLAQMEAVIKAEELLKTVNFNPNFNNSMGLNSLDEIQNAEQEYKKNQSDLNDEKEKIMQTSIFQRLLNK